MPTPSRPAVLELIGNTPLVKVSRFDTGPCTLFLKLESQNPGGSIKDHIGLAMIDAAERDGRLRPGGTIMKPPPAIPVWAWRWWAGPRVTGWCWWCPTRCPRKGAAPQGHGRRGAYHPFRCGQGPSEYYQDVAARLAKDIPGSFFADQFNNPANPLAHETSTAPEIWAQTQHDVDAIVVGVGSAGTLTGLTRFFKRVQPELAIVLADPVGSVMAEYSRSGTLETPAPGRWKASARTSFHRSPTCPACATPTPSAMQTALTTPANCSKPKVSSAAHPPAPCSPLPCATAASKPSPSAW